MGCTPVDHGLSSTGSGIRRGIEDTCSVVSGGILNVEPVSDVGCVIPIGELPICNGLVFFFVALALGLIDLICSGVCAEKCHAIAKRNDCSIYFPCTERLLYSTKNICLMMVTRHEFEESLLLWTPKKERIDFVRKNIFTISSKRN